MIKHPLYSTLNSHSKVLYNPINPDGCVLSFKKPYITRNKWIDFSPYGNDGTIHGASKTPDGYLSFDGINDNITVPNSDSLNITKAITIRVLFIPADVLGTYRTLVSKYITGFNSYRLYQNARALEWKINSTTAGINIPVFTGGNQYDIIVTYDKTLPSKNLKVFVNNIQKSNADLQDDIITNTSSLRIGGDSIANDFWLYDEMKQIEVYNRAWSVSECLQSSMHQY